jgi:hypothetical protein
MVWRRLFRSRRGLYLPLSHFQALPQYSYSQYHGPILELFRAFRSYNYAVNFRELFGSDEYFSAPCFLKTRPHHTVAELNLLDKSPNRPFFPGQLGKRSLLIRPPAYRILCAICSEMPLVTIEIQPCDLLPLTLQPALTDNLLMQLMICSDVIRPFCNPCQGPCLHTDDRLSIHVRRLQKPASWQKTNHPIPNLYDGNQLTCLIGQSVFVSEGITAVLHYQFRKRAVEIMTTDPEAIGNDINAVKDDDLAEVNHAVSEDPLDCDGMQHEAAWLCHL